MKNLLFLILTTITLNLYSQSNDSLKMYSSYVDKNNFFKVLPKNFRTKLNTFLDRRDTLNCVYISSDVFTFNMEHLKFMNYKSLHMTKKYFSVEKHMFDKSKVFINRRVFLLFFDSKNDDLDSLIAYVFY
jgi:hypothetical protein